MENRKVFTLAIGIFWTVLALVSVLLMVSGRTTAAILGVTVVLTASKIVIGISPFDFSDKFSLSSEYTEKKS